MIAKTKPITVIEFTAVYNITLNGNFSHISSVENSKCFSYKNNLSYMSETPLKHRVGKKECTELHSFTLLQIISSSYEDDYDVIVIICV